MVTPSGEKPLELSVRNFGPIAEADIELRPLSVFVGPSNTGKSYLATLIYALHQFFGAGHVPVHEAPYNDPMLSRRLPTLAPLANVAVSPEDVRDLYEWVNVERSKAGATSQSKPLFLEDLRGPIERLVRRAIGGDEQSSKFLDDELVRCFGIIDLGNLVKWPRGDATVFYVHNAVSKSTELSESFFYRVKVGHRGIYVHQHTPQEIPTGVGKDERHASLMLSSEDAEDVRPFLARLELNALAGLILSRNVGPLSQPVYYLPADRAGAVRSHSALTGSLISRASRPSVASQQPTFSGIYGDFLELIVGLGDLPTKPAGPFDTLADSMERYILGGEIRIDSNFAGYPSFFYRPFGWDTDLPLMNASSMVSELAPVVPYLRHVVQPGETLIIEEPESALHPAAQVEFTRLLVAAIKAGIRIIITTHSEWILEELANLVLMNELPVDRRQGFEGADLALGPDEVGAWLFEPNADAGGTVVKEMPLDKEMGNFPSGFGLITADLYNRYVRISNRIEMLTEE